MTSKRSSHNAFTLVEILVVILLIGILLALLIPAVQASREAGRKIMCSNHLRQIGVALENHVSSFGALPYGFIPWRPESQAGRGTIAPISVHGQILPWLDQMSLFNSINFHVGFAANEAIATNPANATSARYRLEVFLCPSDPNSLNPGNSYRACVGPNPYEFDHSPSPGGGGAFGGFRQIKHQDLQDGSSNTTAFSERLQGSGHEQWSNPRVDIWYSGLANFDPRATNDRLANACSSLSNTNPISFTNTGADWILGSYTDTLYNHVGPPNWKAMDCTMADEGHDRLALSGGAFSARSAHGSGVQILLLDGSVRYVSSGINLQSWRALSTRAGSEPQPID